MGPVELLIERYANEGNPLGKGIDPEEVPLRIAALKDRLKASDTDLDLTPTSLDRLEFYLWMYYQNIQELGIELSNDEIVMLVREVAAYVGQVLVISLSGRARWKPWPRLYGSEIEISNDDSPITWIHLSMGNIAAVIWENIVRGVKPKIFRIYQRTTAKRLRQHLPKTYRG